jgi:hypothetical protein
MFEGQPWKIFVLNKVRCELFKQGDLKDVVVQVDEVPLGEQVICTVVEVVELDKEADVVKILVVMVKVDEAVSMLMLN